MKEYLYDLVVKDIPESNIRVKVDQSLDVVVYAETLFNLNPVV